MRILKIPAKNGVLVYHFFENGIFKNFGDKTAQTVFMQVQLNSSGFRTKIRHFSIFNFHEVLI